MMRRFLNLVMESLDTGSYSLRRINLRNHLFYPSATAAEAAAADLEAVMKVNAKKQAGYKHGLRFLQMMASRLEPLPGALINFKPSGPCGPWDTPLDLVSLLGNESRILWSDSMGFTSLYDADSNSVMTMPNLTAPKGCDAIPISVTHATAAGGSWAEQGGRLYVLGQKCRRLHLELSDYCFEELRYDAAHYVLSMDNLFRGWGSPPPPPFYKNPCDICAHAVVGSTLYISSSAPGVGKCTYAYDMLSRDWRHAGNWCLPFYGRAEYVPELNLWFGLSASRPFHLCASDLSAVDFERPPMVHQTWVDLDMPKSWCPFQLDLVNLGYGRFCVVKMFHSTLPGREWSLSDDERCNDDEILDYGDLIHWDFAILTGIQMVVTSPGKLGMLKHKSKYHNFEDCIIKWVL